MGKLGDIAARLWRRFTWRGEPGAVATEIIEQALDEEMGAS